MGMEQDAHLRSVQSKIEHLYQVGAHDNVVVFRMTKLLQANKQYLDDAASKSSPRPLSKTYSVHSRSLTSMPQISPRDDSAITPSQDTKEDR